MKTPSLLLLQTAALAVACVRGLGEMATLQGWRVRDRWSRRT